jgi:hypothetical protein
MTASCRTTAFLWAKGPARETDALLPILVDTFKAFGEKPARMWISTASVKQTAFNEPRLAAALASPTTTSIAVKGPGEAQVHVDIYVRDEPGIVAQFRDRRHVCLIASSVAPDDPRVIRFLDVGCRAYAVAHGAVFHATTTRHATAEAHLVLSSAIGAEAEKRIGFDSLNATRSLHLLRRLYPVTIIGPEIWAKLPPLPAVDPPLVVRDLADCKMVTAWPTLVEPHDLQFLLGTRALRRWLWPHTIQNPADDPDEIDVRLQWAGLLPW